VDGVPGGKEEVEKDGEDEEEAAGVPSPPAATIEPRCRSQFGLSFPAADPPIAPPIDPIDPTEPAEPTEPDADRGDRWGRV
jgi:hypothetical protein